MGREVSIKTVAKMLIISSFIRYYQFSSLVFQGERVPFTFSWLLEILQIIPCFPCHVQLQLHFGIPDPIRTKPDNFPIFLPSPG